MENSDCGDSNHDMTGSDSGTSTHRTAILACSKCGIGQSVELRYLGNRRVKTDMTIFPARGSRTVSRAMIRFFMLSWDLSCREIEGDGYILERGAPEIPPAVGL
jgi:hypothetical protein